MTVVFLRKAVLSVVLVGAFGAAVASADPRWWWSDAVVTNGPGDAITPHVTGVQGNTGGGAGGLFVAYAAMDPAGGDTEIWLTASFDGGCTWCQPTRLTDDDMDETNPRVAVLPLPDGHYSVQVIYERAPQVVIAWDSTTLSTRVPVDQLCGLLAMLGPNVIASSQYVEFGSRSEPADTPDIAAAGNFSIGHFHAVWHASNPAGGTSHVFYAHDLLARGGPGWRADAPRDLTLIAGGRVDNRAPALACDLLTDPDPLSGMNTMNRTGVNVVFIEKSPAGGEEVRGLRSVDSGSTFSPNGDRADAAAGPVSDVLPPSLPRPSIDTAFNTFSFTQPIWAATAWQDLRAGGPEPQLAVDARHLTAPATPAPNWQAPDEILSSTVASDGQTSIGVQASFGLADLAPAWLTWSDGTFGPAEILYRAGVLNGGNPDVIDFNRYPINAVRALDPLVSRDFQLTACAFDPATFGCDPARTAGDARDISLHADPQAVYAVWSDSRAGVRQVYFKKTDTTVGGITARLTTGCSAANTAFIDVSFDVPGSCPRPFSNERMARFLIYYGTNAGGPFVNAASPIEIIQDPALGAVVTRRIDGLVPGTTYQVIVVPEDEARNVSPATFDPTADLPNRYPTEVSIATTTPCAPRLAARCNTAEDHCSSDGSLEGNGSFDFGELVTVTVLISNSGNAPANDYSATLQVTGATIIAPVGGAVSFAAIPPASVRPVPVQLLLPRPADGATCGDLVDFRLVNQVSDAGAVTYPDDDLAGCDFRLGNLADPPACGECAAFPSVTVRACSVIADDCPSGGTGDGDGVIDPGEDFTLEITLENAGEIPATNFTATVQVTGGATLVGAPTIGPVTIATGGQSVQQFTLHVTGGCGDLIDVDVVDLSSDGGTFTWPDFIACNHRIGANVRVVDTVYADMRGFGVPHGGSGTSPLGVDPVENVPVESVMLTIIGNFPDPSTFTAFLTGPSATPVDVTAAILAPIDITASYNGVLGGPGHYTLQVFNSAPAAPDGFVMRWSMSVRDAQAECNACAVAPGPDVRATCTLADRCADNAALNGNGHYDFGELVDVFITLDNVGGTDATNYTATFTVAGATIVTPPGGAITVPSIPAGGSTMVIVTLQLPRPADGAVCEDRVDIALTNQAVDGPLSFPDDPLSACDFDLGDPLIIDEPCEECAKVAVRCLYRGDVTNLLPHTPPRGAVYLVPRSVEDIGLQGLPYQCPFATGELEPDANALNNGVALSLYQVNFATDTLMLAKSGTTILFTF